MEDIRPWTWAFFAAAWASTIILFGVGVAMETARSTSLQKIARSIVRLSIGSAFASGAYAAYFLLQR
jgi:hypothetical protein